ncbi:hypothetical protein GIB67_023982 [Kingdonia uniflora]|uniref:Flotillin-like n=1 Tax=Kingdonia uniflora TaxID=39325 RepID=A0A7J7LPD9_9MAGN|nr:hypothetical protein GIB67_023982 [Kingdonia uniflora]
MNYTFHAMSAEKLSFLLSVVSTIGPRVDDFGSFLRRNKWRDSQTREAEALKNQAKASLFAIKQKAEGEPNAKFKEADGDLYTKIKEVEGLRAFGNGQGFYVKTLMDSFGGSYTVARDYLMINNEIFENIVRINSDVVRGLQPKISIWTNGGDNLDGFRWG